MFSGTLPSFGTRRCAMSVGIRSRFDRLSGRSGGSCAPNAVPSLRASRATPPPPIPQLRLVQVSFARGIISLFTHHSLSLITHLPSLISTHLHFSTAKFPIPQLRLVQGVLRSSRFALTQPDAYGAGASREIRSFGDMENISKNLPFSQSPKLQAAKANTRNHKEVIGKLA